MFEDSLFDSGKQHKRRSPWVTALSFAVQVVLIGVLVLIPILYPEALPRQQFMTFLVAPPPPPPPPPPAGTPAPVKVQKVNSELDNGRLRTPTKIPNKIAKIQEDTPAPGGGVLGGVPGGVPGGVVGGVLGGVLGGIVNSAPAVVPKVATPQKIKVSEGVIQGNLIHDVKPPYPPLARQARIQGKVVLEAVIGKDGTIQNLRVISGHPMLAQAALEAVKQWRYKPYFLNGEPVDVDTTINVNFTLSGG